MIKPLSPLIRLESAVTIRPQLVAGYVEAASKAKSRIIPVGHSPAYVRSQILGLGGLHIIILSLLRDDLLWPQYDSSTLASLCDAYITL